MRSGQTHSQYFGLATYRTWAAAEAAAKKWLQSLTPTLPCAIPIKDRKTKRNSSGIVGVQLQESVKTKAGNLWISYAWKAFWPKRPGGSSWAIIKYGNDQAFVRAVIARRLETTDRRRIEDEFQRISITPEYKEILKHKLLDPP
jgi:hypothetical protein